ncbi:Death effector domain containing 2 [Cichlidogyrus casuarinus]|uniref:Death effector domain containing 2 n=1 Tax=Cichlidogyrus casuarinus TaxID=1844966 RepID=A0ABD2Q2H6_9PLAT
MSASENKPRYVRNWKCQISVGELYRWILAKLSDKDIKRALHKYRDLMPRQSDWNRKLTQATNIPEIGFRYLYRCGQIDESNHRTMQKMLKYIDRQDVLPYFDTILYNTNHANCSLDDLKANVLDKVEEFLKYSTCLSEEEVHPDPPYEIHQCQPLKTRRVTRSHSKRKMDEFEHLHCLTSSKRVKFSAEPGSSSSNLAQCFKSASSVCGQVRSSIMAAGIAGPAVHSHLASSILSMLDALRVSSNSPIDLTSNLPDQSETLSPAALLATLPHLLAFTDLIPAPFLRLIMTAARNSPRIDAFFLSPHLNNSTPSNSSQGQPQQQFRMLQPPNNAAQNGQEAAPQANGHHRFLNLGVQNTRGLASPVSGGVGITSSASDSCLLYYCRIRMRIRLDLGSTPDLRVSFFSIWII